MMTTTSDEEQIRELVETWMAASKAGDTETVLGLMTEDVVFLVSGQPPMMGKAAYAATAAEQEREDAEDREAAPRIDGRSEIREIRVLGDWAYLWTRLRVEISRPGHAEKMVREGHTLSVLKKEGGRWLLARDANVLAPVGEDGDGD